MKSKLAIDENPVNFEEIIIPPEKKEEILNELTLFRMGFLGVCSWMWGVQISHLVPKSCHTYSTMMKLGTVVPYLKNIQKIYESSDIPFEFC